MLPKQVNCAMSNVELLHMVMHVHSVCVGLCLIAMGAANVACVRHMWRARRLQWSKRRFRLVATHYAMLNIQVRASDLPDLQHRSCTSCGKGTWSEICSYITSILLPSTSHRLLEWQRAEIDRIVDSQMLNATFWLAPNARLLQTQCAWCDMHTTPHRVFLAVIRHG